MNNVRVVLPHSTSAQAHEMSHLQNAITAANSFDQEQLSLADGVCRKKLCTVARKLYLTRYLDYVWQVKNYDDAALDRADESGGVAAADRDLAVRTENKANALALLEAARTSMEIECSR